MKQTWLSLLVVSLCATLSSWSHYAIAEDISAETLLRKMSDSSLQLSYELSYIHIKKNSIEPLLYRHAQIDNQSLSYLVNLSGPIKEVIQRNDEISYIESGIEPFSVQSTNMVAPLMPLLGSDIDQLKKNYDFVNIGRAREAGVANQVIRVVPKDGLRYSYILWIDERHYLPLRADLLDRDGDIIEQYRIVSYVVNPQVSQALSSLNEAQLPPVLSPPKSNITQTFWHVNWVPSGFESKEFNRYRIAMTGQVVENQMFSDGLFSFSVYISERDGNSLKNQLVRQGSRTLHSFILSDKEISVIGDIPAETASRIAQSVVFKAQHKSSATHSITEKSAPTVQSLTRDKAP